MNKKIFLKLIFIFCLIGICFTPNIYAGGASIIIETDAETDYSYLNIPFTSTGTPETETSGPILCTIVIKSL